MRSIRSPFSLHKKNQEKYAKYRLPPLIDFIHEYQSSDLYLFHQDFYKYPAEEKANFWAKTCSMVALWKTGRLNLKRAAS